MTQVFQINEKLSKQSDKRVHIGKAFLYSYMQRILPMINRWREKEKNILGSSLTLTKYVQAARYESIWQIDFRLSFYMLWSFFGMVDARKLDEKYIRELSAWRKTRQ